jgi:PAS domain-containing protein
LVLAFPVPLAILDRHGRLVAANRRFEDLAGRPSGELIGALLLGGLIETAADGAARLRDALDAGRVELRLHGSLRFASRGGAVSPVILLRSFTHDGELHVLAWLDELPADRGASETAEREELFRQISGARHHLNNQLMGLLGHAEILRDTEDLPEHVRNRAEAVLRQAARLREAIQQLGSIYKR